MEMSEGWKKLKENFGAYGEPEPSVQEVLDLMAEMANALEQVIQNESLIDGFVVDALRKFKEWK